jgi:hypothetical protein
MAKAIVELMGSVSYQRGPRLFVKNVPQLIEGAEEIAYYRSQEGFSVRDMEEAKAPPAKNEPKVNVPEPEPEPEVEEDNDLPPPAKEGPKPQPRSESEPPKKTLLKKKTKR